MNEVQERPGARKFSNTQKYCPQCDKWKDRSEFRKSNKAESGLQSYCRPCFRKYQRRHPARNRPNSWRKWAYGITPEQYAEIYAEQSGKCALPSCGNPAECIDHDHATDSFRGLLCRKCNTALGMLRDNSELAKEVADYLEKHKLQVSEKARIP